MSSQGECSIISSRSSSDVTSANPSSFSSVLRAPQPPRNSGWAPNPPARGQAAPQRPCLLSLLFIQLHRLTDILIVEHNWTGHASLCQSIPPLRCSYEGNFQLESLALPWITSVAERAGAKHTHVVRQGIIMRLVVPLHTGNGQCGDDRHPPPWLARFLPVRQDSPVAKAVS